MGPGTVLGGRYTVHRRLEQLHGVERWSADDTTLGRTVSILCIPLDDHRTPALLDAARRAASVTHVVFVRILDVGHDDTVAYVVEEDLGDARTMASLVADGGVPGDEVRRITGEVSTALESARQRGMHHLDLTPDDVLRTPDGDIRLRGLETAAVRAGQDGAEAEDAARRDAVGVVALAYAGLTGLWPLGTGGSGLGAAPRVPGGVAAPSEIAAGVPRDLDAICRLTLNDDQGPTSPGDYARQVAPWPSRQVVGRPVMPTGRAPASAAPPGAPAAAAVPTTEFPARVEDTIEHASAPVATEAGTAGAPAAVAGGGAAAAAVAATMDRDTTAHQAPVDAPGREATRVLPLPAPRDSAAGDSVFTDSAPTVSPPTDPPNDAPPTEMVPAGPMRTDGWDDLRWSDGRDDAGPAGERGSRPDAGARPRRGQGLAVGTAAAGGAAGAAVAGALGGVGERVGGFARRAVDKVSELTPDSTAPGDQGLEYPAPMVPAEPLTKDESRLALAIVAGFLVLALVIGIYGISRIGEGSDFSLGGPPTPRPTAAQSSPAEPSASPSPGQSAGNPEPLAILKVEAYDPEGDGEENNRLTPKIYDGDRETGWFSENYRSNSFGGLKKGLGVIVDLGPNKKPQAVELVLPEQADVEVYVGPDNRLEGATRIGRRQGADGTVKFDVPADVSGQYVVVWFTKLSEDDGGKRRAWLNEVVVTG